MIRTGKQFVFLACLFLLILTSCKDDQKGNHIAGSILAGEQDAGLYYRDLPGEGLETAFENGQIIATLWLQEEELKDALYFVITNRYIANTNSYEQSIGLGGNSSRMEFLIESRSDTTYYCKRLGLGTDTLDVFSGVPRSNCQGVLVDSAIVNVSVPKRLEAGEQIGPASGQWWNGFPILAKQFIDQQAEGNSAGDYIFTHLRQQFWQDNAPHYLGFRVLDRNGGAKYGYFQMSVLDYGALSFHAFGVER